MLKRLLRKTCLYAYFKRLKLDKRINAERRREERLVTVNYPADKTEPLTAEEKKQVGKLWGQLLPVNSYKEFEMFKKMYGFDPRFLTHNIYLPIVAHLLNDYKYTKLFDDKGLLGYIKPTCIRFPYCYVRKIEEDYYDNDMRQLSFDGAVSTCAARKELFIKPSHETSGGKDARLLRKGTLGDREWKDVIIGAMSGRGNDYVIQECLHQHPVMAQFNESSINTLRVTTLCLNNRFSVCSVILRCGKQGSTVDNWGAGGIVAVVKTNGEVHPLGHDIHLNEYTHNGNCVFGDSRIPQVPEILRLIEKAHKDDFALCKFIGWDIAIDENNEPVIIELNSSQPGVIGEQLLSGPIFGERTQEVIDYCKAKNFKY